MASALSYYDGNTKLKDVEVHTASDRNGLCNYDLKMSNRRATCRVKDTIYYVGEDVSSQIPQIK